MSDDLSVSVGTTSVIVHELRSAAGRLDRVVIEAGAASAQAVAADRLASAAWLAARGAPPEAVRANSELEHARIALADVDHRARVIAWGLTCAAEAYDGTEQLISSTIGVVADELGWATGWLIAQFLPQLLTGGVPLAAALWVLVGPDRLARIVRDPRVISDPRVVTSIRLAVRASDDAILGLARVPQPVAAALGEHGLDVTGLPFAAAVFALGGRSFGAFKESPVRVAETMPLPVEKAPAGISGRFERVPRPDDVNGAQVVVERYEDSTGRPSFEVYIAGTVDFDPAARGEPWDMASNVSNVIGDDAGSVDGVREALRQAGVQPDDPVQFTGYSQGGAVAAHLVASGDYATAGLVTFGGPTGQIVVPESVPTLFVEHTDDIVPALGGDQENASAVVVRRWATEGMNFEGSEVVPAHQRPAYASTARLIDASGETELVAVREKLESFTDGKRMVERTAYRCVRVDEIGLAPAAPDERGMGWAATSSSGGAAGSRSAS